MSSQNFSMPSGPTTSSQPILGRQSVKPHIASIAHVELKTYDTDQWLTVNKPRAYEDVSGAIAGAVL